MRGVSILRIDERWGGIRVFLLLSGSPLSVNVLVPGTTCSLRIDCEDGDPRPFKEAKELQLSKATR